MARRLQIGEAVVFVESVRERCVMTTFDPDTLVQDVLVLRRIVGVLSLALPGVRGVARWLSPPAVGVLPG